jgi:hypothetical protein
MLTLFPYNLCGLFADLSPLPFNVDAFRYKMCGLFANLSPLPFHLDAFVNQVCRLFKNLSLLPFSVRGLPEAFAAGEVPELCHPKTCSEP